MLDINLTVSDSKAVLFACNIPKTAITRYRWHGLVLLLSCSVLDIWVALPVLLCVDHKIK